MGFPSRRSFHLIFSMRDMKKVTYFAINSANSGCELPLKITISVVELLSMFDFRERLVTPTNLRTQINGLASESATVSTNTKLVRGRHVGSTRKSINLLLLSNII